MLLLGLPDDYSIADPTSYRAPYFCWPWPMDRRATSPFWRRGCPASPCFRHSSGRPDVSSADRSAACGMGLSHLPKNKNAIEELIGKGMAPN
jgi:hypothetical protein